MQIIKILSLSIFLILPISIYSQTVTKDDVKTALEGLDNTIELRDKFIQSRESKLKKYTNELQKMPYGEARLKKMLAIGEAYRGFNSDSALYYMRQGKIQAKMMRNDTLSTLFHLKELGLLPLSGFTAPSIEEYNAIDTLNFSDNMKVTYHTAGVDLYGFLLSMHADNPRETRHYRERLLFHLKELMNHYKPGTFEHMTTEAEYMYHSGNIARSRAIVVDILKNIDASSALYARHAYLMGMIEDVRGDELATVYYLSKSAKADIESATLEVSSLQSLGKNMYYQGDIDRAYKYLTLGLKFAVTSRSELRITEAGNGLALIEAAHNAQISSSRNRVYLIMGLMALALIGLIITLIFLRKEMKKLHNTRRSLEQANEIKEVYISQFLKLCSIYMDKLNQFCKVVNRKISAGKIDELHRMTKSAKFIEEQSAEFFCVFDSAFLHLYPDFVNKVNALLRDNEKIELREDEQLNSDLRILAFMRLGIEESNRIAELLHYSVNTIYAYRNKLKNRAINRETFEDDIMKIN